MAKRSTGDRVATARGTSGTSPNRSGKVSASDIARRAYELYLARGREPGHDLDDWLRAEQELKDAPSSTVG
jgi:Protein of unknown function (DUF2934)